MKKTSVDRAIKNLEAEISLLNLAITKLRATQTAKTERVRKPRAAKAQDGGLKL